MAAFMKRVADEYANARSKSKQAKTAARHMGDHNARRDVSDDVPTTATQVQEAEVAVNDLLDRASESTSSHYMQWDDIGAFNGDRNGY